MEWARFGNLARTPGKPLLFAMSATGPLMTSVRQFLGLTSHPKEKNTHGQRLCWKTSRINLPACSLWKIYWGEGKCTVAHGVSWVWHLQANEEFDKLPITLFMSQMMTMIMIMIVIVMMVIMTSIVIIIFSRRVFSACTFPISFRWADEMQNSG